MIPRTNNIALSPLKQTGAAPAHSVVHKGWNLEPAQSSVRTGSFFASVWNKITEFFTGFSRPRFFVFAVAEKARQPASLPSFLIAGPAVSTDELKTFTPVPRFYKAAPIISATGLQYKTDYLNEAKKVLREVLTENEELFRRADIPENQIDKLHDNFVKNYDIYFEEYFDQYHSEELAPVDPAGTLPTLLPDLHDMIMDELIDDDEQALVAHRYAGLLSSLREEVGHRLRTYNLKMIPSGIPNY
jgi:hypothetical protein